MQEFTCKTCGEDFNRYASVALYCSKRCFVLDHRRIAKCPVCGREKSLEKKKPQKDFCSLVCAGRARRLEEKKCQFCERMFRPRSRAGVGKFCSKPCADKGKTLPKEEFWRRWKLRVKEYRRNNPEKTVVWKQKRRALELGAPGHFTDEEWIKLKKEFCQKCALCGEERKLTVDHKRPLSKGGTNYIENIQPLCMPCNSRKSAKI